MHAAYVLHRRRYRETSLIVEFLTREHGRIAAVARGALRPRSPLAGVLQPLVPLIIETRGRGELLTLVRAEAATLAPAIHGDRLYAVFYLNELLIRLTGVHDPVPALFEQYAHVLHELAGEAPLEPLLRAFECEFLEHVGLGMALETDTHDGQPIDAETFYDYVADRGPARSLPSTGGYRVRGDTLLALAGHTAWRNENAREAKRLMRYVLDHHLDGRPLAARDLFAPSRSRKS